MVLAITTKLAYRKPIVPVRERALARERARDMFGAFLGAVKVSLPEVGDIHKGQNNIAHARDIEREPVARRHDGIAERNCG